MSAILFPPAAAAPAYSSSLLAEPLTSGESIYQRSLAQNASIGITSLHLTLTYWKAATSNTATAVTTVTGGTALTSANYAVVGIYSVASNGNITLVASTANQAAAGWASTFTSYAYTLTPSFVRTAGQIYAMGILMIGSGLPQIYGYQGSTALDGLAPMTAGTYTVPQTTVAAGSNGGEISAIGTWASPSGGVLDVAASTNFYATGGSAIVATSTTPAIITYTGTAVGQLTGCAYVSGSATGTVATGGTVQGLMPPTLAAGSIAGVNNTYIGVVTP